MSFLLVQAGEETLRQVGHAVVLYVELLEVDTVGEAGGDVARVQLVVPQPQSRQLGEVANLWREIQQLVVLQVEAGELPALPQLGRQVLHVVVAAVTGDQRLQPSHRACT